MEILSDHSKQFLDKYDSMGHMDDSKLSKL